MADPSSPESTERERRLEEILAAYLAAEDAGQAPEPEALITRFPDLADELCAFLQELERIRSLAAPLRAVAGAAGDPAELTDPEVGPTRPALPQPVGITTQTTHSLKTTVVLTLQPADDPDATAEVTPDDPPTSDVLDGGTRIRYFGDYELIKVLGRGGMGVVYKARQLSLNRPVALKMLQTGALASEDELRRFQNEAEAVAQLDLPTSCRSWKWAGTRNSVISP
jgi:hypothetical protein